MSQREPIFNLPTGSVIILAGMAVIHILLELMQFINIDTYQTLFYSLAFIPARYSGLVQQIPGGDIADLTSFISYIFVHGGWEHLLVNSLFILAFGSAIARRMGTARFLAYSALCGSAGAGLHLWLHWGSVIPVVGASAAASGYIAGTTILIFSAWRNGQLYLINRNPAWVKRMTPVEILTDPGMILLIVIWVAVNWFVGDMGFGTDGTTSIAWEAHMGGYIAGIVGFFMVDRQEIPGDDINQNP